MNIIIRCINGEPIKHVLQNLTCQAEGETSGDDISKNLAYFQSDIESVLAMLELNKKIEIQIEIRTGERILINIVLLVQRNNLDILVRMQWM
jgi:biotin operon repressor